MIVRFSSTILAAVLLLGQTSVTASTVSTVSTALEGLDEALGRTDAAHSHSHSHLRARHFSKGQHQRQGKGENDDIDHDDEQYPEDDDFHPEGDDTDHDDEQYPDDDDPQSKGDAKGSENQKRQYLVSLPGEYQSFKEEFNLHPDTILHLYDLTDVNTDPSAGEDGSYGGVLAIHHKDYTIDFVVGEDRDSFQPMDIYTKDATYTRDGEEVRSNGDDDGDGPMQPSVYFKRHGRDGIIVTMNHDGQHKHKYDNDKVVLNVNNIQNIQIMGQDGGDTQLHSVAPGIFAEIKPEDFDPDYVSLLHTLEMKKSYVPEKNRDEDQDNTGEDELPPKSFDATLRTTSTEQSRQRHRQLQTQCAQYVIIEVAIIYDSTLCAQQGGHAQAKNRIEAVFSKSSFMYQRQNICAKLKMASLEGHCSSSADPYKGGIATGTIGCNTENIGVLNYFQQYWRTNKTGQHRDIAHLFFARNFGENTVGCAFMSVLCNKNWGYGANNFSFSSNTYQLAALFAHEAGHNVGLDHVPSNHNDPFVMGSHLGRGEHVWSTGSKTILDTNIPKAVCTTAETTGNTCQDTPVGWHDADGSAYNCGWYAMGNNCADYGHGWRYNGKNAGEACCACGGGKALDVNMAVYIHEQEDQKGEEWKEQQGDSQGHSDAGISCGCPSCTSDILETVVENKTIAEHISWIVDNLNESEIDACELVCGEEFDEICGDACNPSQCHSFF